ncbi:MAG: murein L,D-transpeptidase catalytic domain family protein [Chitinophagaceae bacterium]|nr:MAG: murein L,D-transpeptidase catalytic domain family protein [Chitinophagaceae bacterium]
MKKSILPLLLLLVSFVTISAIKAGGRGAATVAGVRTEVISEDSSARTDATAVATNMASIAATAYGQLGLDALGLSKEAFIYAYKGLQNLTAQGAVVNQDVLTVIDFSQSSAKKRMYIVDLKEMKVLFNTYVAHGKNSGLQYAERFSNQNESLQSSLGFYVTKGTYMGKHGISLRLSGKEAGWNSNAEARAVVLHGAEYIGSGRADAAYMGRSWGCPAVPQAQVKTVINLIKDGTALFIYHPTQKYISSSKLINS